MELNVIGDFINKDICPYCGRKLKNSTEQWCKNCTKCESYFRFIDSPGPDGYYLPRELKKSDYFYNCNVKIVDGKTKVQLKK